MSNGTRTLPVLSDDGLLIGQVGSHSETKYKLLAHYLAMFNRAMRRDWPRLVYVNLYCGSGCVRIGEGEQVFGASPMIALETDPPFDELIFCDENPAALEALQDRLARDHAHRSTHVIAGDCNAQIDQICTLARGARSCGSLVFGFVDPYQASSLQFDTLRKLSLLKIDLMMLIPSEMDIHRNPIAYTKETNHILDGFLGQTAWRARWEAAKQQKKRFGSFITEELCEEMRGLGFKYVEVEDLAQVRHVRMNRTLYLLTLFSRHDLGIKFWKAAVTAASPQRQLI